MVDTLWNPAAEERAAICSVQVAPTIATTQFAGAPVRLRSQARRSRLRIESKFCVLLFHEGFWEMESLFSRSRSRVGLERTFFAPCKARLANGDADACVVGSVALSLACGAFCFSVFGTLVFLCVRSTAPLATLRAADIGPHKWIWPKQTQLAWRDQHPHETLDVVRSVSSPDVARRGKLIVEVFQGGHCFGAFCYPGPTLWDCAAYVRKHLATCLLGPEGASAIVRFMANAASQAGEHIGVILDDNVEELKRTERQCGRGRTQGAIVMV